MAETFSLCDLAGLLQRAFGDGVFGVLIGGQAVNCWAATLRDQDALAAYRPLASRDLNFYGGPVEARRLAERLRIGGRFNDGTDPSPNAAVLTARLDDGRQLIIDVLTAALGVSGSELALTAIAVRVPGTDVLVNVMHPLLLLESKLTYLRQLPQANRQDEKHVRTLTHVLAEQLRDIVDQPRELFRSLERYFQLTITPVGRHAAERGIRLWDAVPLEAMRFRYRV